MATTTQSSSEVRTFVLWAIDQLELVVTEANGVCRVTIPSDLEGPLAERNEWIFTFDDQVKEKSGDQQLERVTIDSPLMQELITTLSQEDHAIAAYPAEQPESVHELTNRLFPAYTIDGGNVHLGGCTLENRPFLRLSFGRSTGDPSNALTHAYFDSEGVPVQRTQIAELGLDRLKVCGDDAPKLAEADLHMLVRRARVACQDELTEEEPLLAETLIWCKYAIGKIVFTIGELERELNFAGWAKTLSAPPVNGEDQEIQSYHLAATDDGRIATVEEIEVCSESARRALRSQMVQCSVSGKWLLPEFSQTCPVTGQPVAPQHLTECPTCRQQVSSTAMAGSTCRACRTLKSVSKDDPRMARLLGEHPGLDRCRSWKLAESAGVYIATAASGLLRQVLLVVDKETLEPRRIATGNRFLGGWTDLEASQVEKILR